MPDSCSLSASGCHVDWRTAFFAIFSNSRLVLWRTAMRLGKPLREILKQTCTLPSTRSRRATSGYSGITVCSGMRFVLESMRSTPPCPNAGKTSRTASKAPRLVVRRIVTRVFHRTAAFVDLDIGPHVISLVEQHTFGYLEISG